MSRVRKRAQHNLSSREKTNASQTIAYFSMEIGRYRLCQETILGIGGVRMLEAVGLKKIQRYLMNEGHASLLTLELLDSEVRKAGRSVMLQQYMEKAYFS